MASPIKDLLSLNSVDSDRSITTFRLIFPLISAFREGIAALSLSNSSFAIFALLISCVNVLSASGVLSSDIFFSGFNLSSISSPSNRPSPSVSGLHGSVLYVSSSIWSDKPSKSVSERLTAVPSCTSLILDNPSPSKSSSASLTPLPSVSVNVGSVQDR